MKTKALDPTGRPTKTYLLGRACQYCSEPIADQERANKTHCTRYRDENGVVHDCKRRKHQLNHQLSEDFLLDWCALQRQTKARIEDALTAHGDEVTVDILDAYNINLHDNIRFYFNSGATYVEFLDYNIIIRPNFKTLKIQKNEKSGLLKDDRKTA
jgi:hypothetical protein